MDSYEELLRTTDWSHYGTESGNPKCANCMVSCGYEPSAVNDGFGSVRGFFAMARSSLFHTYKDRGALDLLNQPVQPIHGFNPLVQITTPSGELEETRA